MNGSRHNRQVDLVHRVAAHLRNGVSLDDGSVGELCTVVLVQTTRMAHLEFENVVHERLLTFDFKLVQVLHVFSLEISGTRLKHSLLELHRKRRVFFKFQARVVWVDHRLLRLLITVGPEVVLLEFFLVRVGEVFD